MSRPIYLKIFSSLERLTSFFVYSNVEMDMKKGEKKQLEPSPREYLKSFKTRRQGWLLILFA